MILNPDDGTLATSPEAAEQLQGAGYIQCYGKDKQGSPCNFHISPEAQSKVLQRDAGYYTCPRCKLSHDLLEEMPYHPSQDDSDWSVGGGTRIGIPMEQQAQIGENVIQGLQSLPGYGPIVWWHEGGAIAKSPLDGATKDWGIEVKTIGYDAWHHRFIPGSSSEKSAKDTNAESLGLRGILGLLVLLNYKTSMADVYVKEMPLEGWKNAQGRQYYGVGTFRSAAAQHLLEQVPFKNPLMDPLDGAPHTATPVEEPPF